MRNESSPLTSKQLRWVDEYLVDFNGAAAAVRAGFSAKTARSIACELLTKPDIQAVLQARQNALALQMRTSREGVIQGLLEAIDMGKMQQNPGAMVSGLREVAKMLGFYAQEDKRGVQAAAAHGNYPNLALLTDVELSEAIAAGNARLSAYL